MIYLDSSALIKLIFEEPESGELSDWLYERQDASLISSALAKVEVLRTCSKRGELALSLGRDLLSRIDLIPIRDDVIEDAARIGGSGLRTLDAIHLASVTSIGGAITALVAYDIRLLESAAELGLPCVHPGLN